MLTSETKRRIDAARQVLVGVVPNPILQIEQITTALIYKFMDEMDQAAIKNGDKPTFFIGDLGRYSWMQVMNTRIGNQERMNLYVEALNKFSESKKLPELFRNIFKSAILPYRSPDVLTMFLQEINGFDYSHPEELGNAYEYLLQIMGSQGEAGQFRTPRHIIDFIVAAVDPTKDDRVLDPACGTAGFLISAYKHILAQHDGHDENGRKNKERALTPDERRKLMENFEGYDIDPGMVRISRVNMYLHQFKDPKIYNYDSLSSEERWSEKFDVILANPPFMSPKGGIKPHSKFSIESSRSEVLFVDYIMNHLRPKGRAGIIVPEGVIFQSGKAYKQLRANLVKDGLYAVVSLPSGVFQPYSGVKTSILLFNNELAKRSEEIVFIKVESDGFDTGATRRPIDRNDLPEALKILDAWKRGEKVESAKAVYVEKSKIAESGEYNLSGDRYHTATDFSNVKWSMVKLGDILDYEQPTKYIVKSVDYSDDYPTPVLTAGKSFVLGHTNETEGVYRGKLPVIIFDDFTTASKLVDFPFKVKSSAMKILHANKKMADIRYVFHAMQNIKFSFSEHKRFWISEFSKFKIPLPPLEIQKQIVVELDGYQSIITGAKQIVFSWKPKIDIDPEWPKVKLGDVCKTTSGGTPLKSKSEYYNSGKIPWLRSGEVAQGFITKSELFINEEGVKNSSAKLLPVNTILVAMYGATAGQVGILKFESTTNQAVCGVLPNKKFIPEFLFQALRDKKETMISFAGGGAQPNISQGVIRNLEIPLPPLEIQKQIVARIESERALVDSAKKLIEIYTTKTHAVLSNIWGE